MKVNKVMVERPKVKGSNSFITLLPQASRLWPAFRQLGCNIAIGLLCIWATSGTLAAADAYSTFHLLAFTSISVRGIVTQRKNGRIVKISNNEYRIPNDEVKKNFSFHYSIFSIHYSFLPTNQPLTHFLTIY